MDYDHSPAKTGQRGHAQDEWWLRQHATPGTQTQPPADKPVGDIVTACEVAKVVSVYSAQLADRTEVLINRLLGSAVAADSEPQAAPLPNGAVSDLTSKMRASLRSNDRISAALDRLENALEG